VKIKHACHRQITDYTVRCVYWQRPLKHRSLTAWLQSNTFQVSTPALAKQGWNKAVSARRFNGTKPSVAIRPLRIQLRTARKTCSQGVANGDRIKRFRPIPKIAKIGLSNWCRICC